MLIKCQYIVFCFVMLSVYNCSNEKSNIEFEETSDFVQFYSTQSIYTDPGEYVFLYENIPTDIEQVVNCVQNVLLHLVQVEISNLPVSQSRIDDEINITNVEDLLEALYEKNRSLLINSRSNNNKIITICSHYAMLTCSILRHKGFASRMRGGFELYHSPNKHHDHWICEYWNAKENRWIKVDAELNDFLKSQWQITYNNLDLPENVFISGSQLWQSCRDGKDNPSHFGIKGDRWYGGWDFVLNAVVLDFLALNKIELLPWDGNELSEDGIDELDDEKYHLLDKTAKLVVAGNAAFKEMRLFYKNNEQLQKY